MYDREEVKYFIAVSLTIPLLRCPKLVGVFPCINTTPVAELIFKTTYCQTVICANP